jgi:putative ABC transport system permease protein
MLKNYLKIAVRNMLRNKTYSFINIFGLSVGVACCLMLSLFIFDEYRYDKHHKDLDNLYRIITEFQGNKGFDKLATASPPIAMALQDEIPEIVSATRALNPPGVAQNLIKYQSNLFYEENGLIADSTLFDVLTYEFIEGNPAKALVEANSVVITNTLAHKLFGNEPALNKVINIAQGFASDDFKVTGVFKEEQNSHIQATFFISMTSSGWGEYLRSDRASGEWAGQNFVPSYLKLIPGHDKEAVIKKMNEVLVKYGSEDMKALGMSKTLTLQPLRDIYLKSDFNNTSPRITYLYIIAFIAAFILLIACINFMNLSTAKATQRAGEIGMRKVMGAFRSSLIGQIMGEAMAIVFISMIISVAIVQLLLPFFNQLIGKNISFESETLLYTSLALAGITLVTGLLAGSYPAFYLSSFQPAQVLKGKTNLSNASGLFRQSLVVFQFMIAIALVCGMIIISQQLKYIQEKDLGFNAESKIVLPLRTENASKSYEALKQELVRNNIATEVSATAYLPGSTIWSDMMFYKQGGNMDNAILNRRNMVDAGYIELLDIQLVAGRTFTNNRETESQRKVIVNETSARRFGYEPEQIIGEQVFFEWQGEKFTYEVIGVIADYHQNSLKDEINPIMFEMPSETDQYGYLVANVKSTSFNETISKLEQTWKQLVNDTPFEFTFLDESIQKQYDDDKKASKIITSFTVIAMVISCLGLYGLSTYMAERRFKEIGVRKVLGANVGQIVGLMSKEFVKLVMIAFVISVPLAWYAMQQWLASFAYKITINIMVFVYAGAAALVIALLTISFESLKAASTDPVKALRNE